MITLVLVLRHLIEKPSIVKPLSGGHPRGDRLKPVPQKWVFKKTIKSFMLCPNLPLNVLKLAQKYY